MQRSDTYLVDLSDPLQVFHFPNDFADHLRDLSREDEADDFLRKWHMYASYLPEEDLAENGLDHVITIARMFAPVEDVSHAPKNPFPTAEQVLEEIEREETAVWDRELETMDRDTPEMLDLEQAEFPEVSILIDVGDIIPDLLVRAYGALKREGEFPGAERLRKESIFFLSRRPTNYDLFKLIWSYVQVFPSEAFLEEEDAMLRVEWEELTA